MSRRVKSFLNGIPLLPKKTGALPASSCSAAIRSRCSRAQAIRHSAAFSQAEMTAENVTVAARCCACDSRCTARSHSAAFSQALMTALRLTWKWHEMLVLLKDYEEIVTVCNERDFE